MSIPIIKTDDPLNDSQVIAIRDCLRAGELVAAGTSPTVNVGEVVSQVIEGVRTKGDEYVIEETARLHGVKLKTSQLSVPEQEIESAFKDIEKNEPDFLPIVRKVIANIREYQQSILLRNPPDVMRGGRTLGLRYTPIDSVALYVPGGKAAYPSSLLMTCVPAQVAGVQEIVVVSPPGEGGSIKPIVLAAAHELGIRTIYRVSGVAGLAAVAFGTESIKPVAKIAGPGSAFITEAKRQLFGRVGIDSVAGPSEVLIIADETARGQWVAADMLAQGEHGPGSAILVTTSQELANEVAKYLDEQMEQLKRKELIKEAIDKYSGIIVVPDLDIACAVANDFATEHLQIVTAADDATLAKIRNAGAIFLGPYTPVPLGDYYAGPSHVLPTGSTARFFSALSCNDFLKGSSTIRYDEASLEADAKDVATFAEYERLTAHARAVQIRKKDK
ncbi:MAG: histidinol dehydrogenase [Planctomycetota bacterium]|jgi:histidinol dehydrogenase